MDSVSKILNSYDVQDITPSISGFLNLVSYSMNGSYEIREYICATTFSKILVYGNYTNIPLGVIPGYCVQIVNNNPHPIQISYMWQYGGSVNLLFLISTILYILILISLSTYCLCGCAGIGGFIKQLIFTLYYRYFNKDNIIIDERIPPQCEENQIKQLSDKEETESHTIEMKDSIPSHTIEMKDSISSPSSQLYETLSSPPMNFIDIVAPSAPILSLGSKPLPPIPTQINSQLQDQAQHTNQRPMQSWSFPKK